MRATETTDPRVAKLEAAGLTVRVWRDRLYVRDGSRELGYLLPRDDGSTGTCLQVLRRTGYVAAILRGQR